MSQTIQPPVDPAPRPRHWLSWRSGRTLVGIAVVISLAIGLAVLLGWFLWRMRLAG